MEFVWRERPLKVSPHAVLRWIERVENVDIEMIRRLADAAITKGRSHDRTIVRMIEQGLGVDLDRVRSRIFEAIGSGRLIERRTGFNVEMQSGHLVCVVRDHAGDWGVATVLSPDMGTGRRIPVDGQGRPLGASPGMGRWEWTRPGRRPASSEDGGTSSDAG